MLLKLWLKVVHIEQKANYELTSSSQFRSYKSRPHLAELGVVLGLEAGQAFLDELLAVRELPPGGRVVGRHAVRSRNFLRLKRNELEKYAFAIFFILICLFWEFIRVNLVITGLLLLEDGILAPCAKNQLE